MLYDPAALNTTGTHKRRVHPLLLAGLAALSVACAGCGEAADAGAGGGSASSQAVVATAHIALHLDVGNFSQTGPNAVIRGTVTRGARVTVNRQRASVHGTHWSKTLHLRLGENTVSVVATLAGRRSVHKTITVTREKSAAEIEAEAQAQERSAATSPTTSTPQETCTNGTYVNSAGNTVCRPEESPTVPAGATAECADGTYSFSESRSGTCSHHGGVARWLE